MVIAPCDACKGQKIEWGEVTGIDDALPTNAMNDRICLNSEMDINPENQESRNS